MAYNSVLCPRFYSYEQVPEEIRYSPKSRWRISRGGSDPQTQNQLYETP